MKQTMTPTREQELWMGDQLAKLHTPERVNPCIQMFGPGPEGAKCKGCVHLYSNEKSRRYYKCRFRYFSNGAKTQGGRFQKTGIAVRRQAAARSQEEIQMCGRQRGVAGTGGLTHWAWRRIQAASFMELARVLTRMRFAWVFKVSTLIFISLAACLYGWPQSSRCSTSYSVGDNAAIRG